MHAAMAYVNDSLRSAIEAHGSFTPGQDGSIALAFSHTLAIAAYMSSGMMKKVIGIPAGDRVREWRDWQADKSQIELIEAEERRLNLQAKVREAEVLRGVGGGALILVTDTMDHSSELKSEQIAKGGLVAVNVVSRWQISGVDWVKDISDPQFGNPRMFEIDGGTTGRKKIHPSRVVCFRGERLPAGYAVSDEEAFWGDSRLLRVFTAVQRSDDAQGWIATLVKKAKLLRIGIPDLLDMIATDEGKKQLNERVRLIAQGENAMNATVYRSGSGTDDPGEQIDDYQITWAGIPELLDAFNQSVSAVSGIPFTVLMGRSPGGMNATGDHDRQNWNREVVAGQELELRPCLDQIDTALIPSALGSRPADLWWSFTPLDTPSEQESALTFKTTLEAATALQNTGAIPDIAFSKGLQNLMVERGWMPGLDQALSEIPEVERYPEGPTEEEIRAEEQARAAQKGGDQNLPAGLNDAAPRPLYVQRKLLNGGDLIKWAKSQGFETTLPADDMHVTVLYSRTAVDPMKMGEGWSSDPDGGLVVKAGGPRAVERLGENAVVLLFASWSIVSRHNEMVEAGGSHDYPEYQPHVTLSYTVPVGVDLEAIKPYAGELRFGPEIFEPLDLDWKSKISEA